MKAIAILALFAAAGFAQEAGTAKEKSVSAEQQALIDKRNHKLEKEWLKKAPWITDYDQARAEAKKTGKPIFGYFSRSYAP